MSNQSVSTKRDAQVLYRDKEHQFIWLGGGDSGEEMGIASNQFLILDNGEGMILDPGGYHVFERVFENVSNLMDLQKLNRLFLSHQDPDICVSLISWLEVRPDVEVVVSRLWERFVSHLALPVTPNWCEMPDEGGVIALKSGATVQVVPAHFLHSPGNFHAYDSRSRTLFTGDMGASVVPDDEWELYASDFDAHVKHMEGFHRRYMSSTKALKSWLKRVRHLEIDRICPQHGPMLQGENVKKFLNWLDTLEVGMDYKNWGE